MSSIEGRKRVIQFRLTVSISSIIQQEPEHPPLNHLAPNYLAPNHLAPNQQVDCPNAVPLVIMTHTTTEGAISRSKKELDRMDCIEAGSVRMRVLD